MASMIPVEQVEIFGSGVLRAEGVVIDKEGNAWGGGRNGIVYKVSPDGVVHEVAQFAGPGPSPTASRWTARATSSIATSDIKR